MRILMLAGDAFGGEGGIAQHNQDAIGVVSALPFVTEIVVVPRLVTREVGPLPPKVVLDQSGLGGKFAFMKAVARQVLTRRFDVVHCLLINLAPVAWLAANIQRAQWLITIHGVDAWTRTGSRLTDWAADRADHIVSVSSLTLGRFLSFAPYREDQTSVVPNPIRLENWRMAPPRPGFAESLGVAGRKVILTVGRMAREERYKGFDEVIEAMPRLLQSHPDLVYLIAGDGSDRARLEAKVAAAGLGSSVRFLGYVSEEDKRDLYRLADAFVMPSYGEGFGIVFLEAMASGTPVLGSNVDGGREALREGELGILVDPHDPGQVADGILRVLSRPKEVPQGLEHFAFPAFAARFGEVYRKLARNGAPKPSGRSSG